MEELVPIRTYELELLDNQKKSLQKINGNFGATAEGSLVTMRFKKDVQIKPNIVYTLTLLIKGGQIRSGDRGQDSVTGPDGTKILFTFLFLFRVNKKCFFFNYLNRNTKFNPGMFDAPV